MVRSWRAAPCGLYVALFAVVVCGAASPAHAVQNQVRILVDADAEPATGCTVPTPEGPFDGVEWILTTTIETVAVPSPSATVTEVTKQACVDASSDTFGPPVVVDPGDWPVGVDLGLDAFDVVETYLPLSDLPANGLRIRVAVVSDDGQVSRALLETSPRSGQDIFVAIRSILEIPALGGPGLVALAALLALAAAARLRRRPRAALLVVAALLGATGVAWAACVLDGDPGDWAPGQEIADNPPASCPGGGAEIRAVFAQTDPGHVCFRVDTCLRFNTPPVADPQSVSTPEDTPLGITLTGSDADSDPLTFSIVPATGPSHGGLTGTPPDVTYTPAANYHGPDGFDFRVDDGHGGTGTATVSITVTPVNDPPVADADGYTVDEGATLNVTAPGVLGGDDDVDGDPLTAVLVAGPSHAASFTLHADGSFDYTHDGSETTSDTFTYEANDGALDSNVATVTITVNAVNDAPVAVDDTYAVDEGGVLNVSAPGRARQRHRRRGRQPDRGPGQRPGARVVVHAQRRRLVQLHARRLGDTSRHLHLQGERRRPRLERRHRVDHDQPDQRPAGGGRRRLHRRRGRDGERRGAGACWPATPTPRASRCRPCCSPVRRTRRPSPSTPTARSATPTTAARRRSATRSATGRTTVRSIRTWRR